MSWVKLETFHFSSNSLFLILFVQVTSYLGSMEVDTLLPLFFYFFGHNISYLQNAT